MGFLKPRFEHCAIAAKEDFREALGKWFSEKGKDYPWRRAHDPYAILISEVMLQQTRIATVLGKGYYTNFLKKFPNVETLGAAGDEELLKAWEGLGYYRRARMLRETAKAVVADHGGVFPDEEALLLKLPGIGPYTSAALMAFAFGRPSSLVDGNVSRVLSRLMNSDSPIDSTAAIKQHREWAGTLCDTENPARHHHAMMELGQTICRPGVPFCEVCPVAGFCKTSTPELLPVKKARVKITEITEHAIWCQDADDRVLLHHETGKRRTGLWKLPLRSDAEFGVEEFLFEDTYHITRYKVRLKIYRCTTLNDIQPSDEWIAQTRLDEVPMAAPFRKALNRLLADF
jgi:A/G-specific adenine glycosylase